MRRSTPRSVAAEEEAKVKESLPIDRARTGASRHWVRAEYRVDTKPFLTFSRHEIVELASPWDPKSLIADYVEAAEPGFAVFLPPDDLIALDKGAVVRFDLPHGRFGTVEAELHLDVLQPTEVAVELAAVIALKWWCRLIAFPFRSRARRWIDRRVDQMIDELRLPPTQQDGEEASLPEDTPEPTGPRAGDGGWTLKLLTLDGRCVYERTASLD